MGVEPEVSPKYFVFKICQIGCALVYKRELRQLWNNTRITLSYANDFNRLFDWLLHQYCDGYASAWRLQGNSFLHSQNCYLVNHEPLKFQKQVYGCLATCYNRLFKSLLTLKGLPKISKRKNFRWWLWCSRKIYRHIRTCCKKVEQKSVSNVL